MFGVDRIHLEQKEGNGMKRVRYLMEGGEMRGNCGVGAGHLALKSGGSAASWWFGAREGAAPWSLFTRELLA
jgi:hypothetical protein